MTSREVVVLGAGFSHAISAKMPLLNDLGVAAIERVGLTGDPRVPTTKFREGFTFENWLTTLAEDQPHLSSAVNGDNAALFLKLRNSVVEVLNEAEIFALMETPPRWLATLVLLLHHRQATVVTFNYDRLIEIALERLFVVDTSPKDLALVGARDALLNRPPVPVGDDVYGGDFFRTFQLLKLHGSLDWWIAPHDETGSTLIRKRLEVKDGFPQAMNAAQRSQLLPGREVFAVPPTHSKAPYYRNFITRELWSSSYEVLREASTISIVGYSLPAADVTLLGMLEQATRGRDIHVEVVNREPEPIAKRLRDMGIANVSEISGDDSVEQFVSNYAARANDRFRYSMRLNGPLAPPDYPVVVTTKMVDKENLFYRVIDLHNEASCLVLDAIPRGRNFTNAASNDELGDIHPRSMSVEIAKALEGSSRVVVRVGERTLLPVSTVTASGPILGGPLALLVSAVEIPHI
ncbi:MAG TPA: hypothetical protein VIJ40_02390 [Acidimicrobiales bacterium]